MDANELIDRYVNEVGQKLPRRSRADIKLELKSLLLDELEERAAAAGKEPTAEMAAEILIEYGKPEVMAARYKTEQYLIGPQLFPFYRLIVAIVLAAIAVSLLVAFGITAAVAGLEDIGSLAWAFLKAYFQSGVMAFASITIIFGILERLYAHKIQTGEDAEWDPYSLEPVEEPDRTKRPELVAGIIWYVILIILFNFFPQWIGMVDTIAPGGVFIPLLSPEFTVFIPWLSAYWTLGIGLKLYLLWQGRWQRPSRWMEFGLSIFGLYIAYHIATGDAITTMSLLDIFIRFGLWIGIIAGSVQAVVQLSRLLRGKSQEPAGDMPDLKTSH